LITSDPLDNPWQMHTTSTYEYNTSGTKQS
jgi:hypothetical protein